MSTLLHDLASQAAVAAAVPPQTLSDSGPLDPVELPDADGPAFAVLQVGQVASGTTLTLTAEESDTGAAWSAVPDGTLTAGELTAGLASVLTFHPTRRLLRCNLTFGGPAPEAALAVLVGRQRKLV